MNKLFSLVANGRSKLAQFGAGLGSLALVSLAHAQEVDPFTTAAATITTRIGTYGAALVAVSAIGVVFMVAMKYVKKLPRAS